MTPVNTLVFVSLWSTFFFFSLLLCENVSIVLCSRVDLALHLPHVSTCIEYRIEEEEELICVIFFSYVIYRQKYWVTSPLVGSGESCFLL